MAIGQPVGPVGRDANVDPVEGMDLGLLAS